MSGKKVPSNGEPSRPASRYNKNVNKFLRLGIFSSRNYGYLTPSTPLYQHRLNSSIPKHTEIFSHLVTAGVWRDGYGETSKGMLPSGAGK
jgi:hypothetical protein